MLGVNDAHDAILQHRLGRTALHEAAHAVTALVCGARVVWVSLSPPRCYLRGYGPRESVLIALAPAAYFSPEREEIPGGALSEADYRFMEPGLQYWRAAEAWNAARAIVSYYRPAIEAVARALLERGRLSGDEVKRLTRRVLARLQGTVFI